jgi:hypothetical protein
MAFTARSRPTAFSVAFGNPAESGLPREPWRRARPRATAYGFHSECRIFTRERYAATLLEDVDSTMSAGVRRHDWETISPSRSCGCRSSGYVEHARKNPRRGPSPWKVPKVQKKTLRRESASIPGPFEFVVGAPSSPAWPKSGNTRDRVCFFQFGGAPTAAELAPEPKKLDLMITDLQAHRDDIAPSTEITAGKQSSEPFGACSRIRPASLPQVP